MDINVILCSHLMCQLIWKQQAHPAIIILIAHRCTTNPKRYEVHAARHTTDYTENLRNLLSTKPLWDEFRIDINIIVSATVFYYWLPVPDSCQYFHSLSRPTSHMRTYIK